VQLYKKALTSGLLVLVLAFFERLNRACQLFFPAKLLTAVQLGKKIAVQDLPGIAKK